MHKVEFQVIARQSMHPNQNDSPQTNFDLHGQHRGMLATCGAPRRTLTFDLPKNLFRDQGMLWTLSYRGGKIVVLSFCRLWIPTILGAGRWNSTTDLLVFL